MVMFSFKVGLKVFIIPLFQEPFPGLPASRKQSTKSSRNCSEGPPHYGLSLKSWKRSVREIEPGTPIDMYSSVEMSWLLIRQTFYLNVFQSSQIIIAKIALSFSSWLLIAKRRLTCRSLLLNYKQNKILSNILSLWTDFQSYIIILKNSKIYLLKNPYMPFPF